MQSNELSERIDIPIVSNYTVNDGFHTHILSKALVFYLLMGNITLENNLSIRQDHADSKDQYITSLGTVANITLELINDWKNIVGNT